MRLSELLGAPVVDGTGAELGRVKDVCFVQDGPFVEGFGHQLRVAELLVGKGPAGVRLGYVQGVVRGPWPLSALFGRLGRRTRRVPWETVVHCDADGGTVKITTV